MLPREISTENWPDRASFDLPRRPIGKLRLLGLPMIGFAILFAWSPAGQVLSLLRHVAEGRAETGDWIMGSFTFLFVLAALIPFAMGMFVFMGRTRIVVNAKWIRVTECAGPFRWSRRVRCQDVVGLQLGLAQNALHGADLPQTRLSAMPPGLSSLGALLARKRLGKPAMLALGYPRDWIEPLAAELSGIMCNFGQTVAVQTVNVLPASPSPVVQLETAAERPVGTSIEVIESPGAVEVRVPSRGLLKQSHGLFLFGIVWCLMTAGFSFAFFHGRNPWGVETFAFMTVFWGLGLGMAAAGLHIGTCRWTLKADSLSLEAVRTSALRTRAWKWQRPDIARIVVGRSGIAVNGRSLDELQVHPVTGKKRGMMTGRSADELAWMAFLLRKALRLEAATPDPDLAAR